MKKLLLALALLFLGSLDAHAVVDRSCNYTQGTTSTQKGFDNCNEEFVESYKRGFVFATCTGTDDYVCTSSPAVTALTDGLTLRFIPPNTNTTTVRINLDGTGLVNAADATGTNITSSSTLLATTYYTFHYDAANSKWRRADPAQSATVTVSATDKLLCRVSSGSGSVEECDFSDFFQTLTNAADAPTLRTLLGLAIGINVQAWDADLDLWANKAPPSGLVVGDTDGQTLTNKTISGGNFTGTTNIQEAIAESGDITPSQITANTDDYAPTGLSGASVLRLSTDASRNLTGLTGGSDGRRIIIRNVGSFDLVLKDDTTSTAANRFQLPSDVTLTPGSQALLQYDATAQRWFAVSGAGGSGTGVSDGDKGDIVVSSSGTVWSLDQGTPVTAFGSGDTFPCFEGSTLKQCSYSDLPGAGAGISNVVEDTTPQLGGALDANTFSILFDDGTGLLDQNGNEALIIETIASAVNYLDLSPSATGNAVTLETAGGDTNVGLNFIAKGSGSFTFEGNAIWHAGNDGSGSGLDADTIDGVGPTTFGLSLIDDAAASNARTTLGLGTIATQDASNVTITGGAISGVTISSLGAALGIGDGGTGQTTAAGAFGALKQDATTSATGVCELATTAEALAGSDTTRCVTPEGVKFKRESICVAVSDETTAITTGTAKVTFRMPYAFTLTAVRFSVNTASSSGLPTVDINENGSTILSTKLSIDASEKTSTTAASAAVISDTSLADDAEITIDQDVAGTGAKGGKVCLIGHQ